MGCFSFFTQDTHERIVNGRPMHVVMCDDKGNKYVEECYEGYGVFGGKDFYELLAEMNGYHMTCCGGCFLYIVHSPEGGSIGSFDNVKDAKECLRQKGIWLAFNGYPHGDNPNLKWPSLTRTGRYCNGECPESDPNQGFPDEWIYGDDEEYCVED